MLQLNSLEIRNIKYLFRILLFALPSIWGSKQQSVAQKVNKMPRRGSALAGRNRVKPPESELLLGFLGAKVDFGRISAGGPSDKKTDSHCCLD